MQRAPAEESTGTMKLRQLRLRAQSRQNLLADGLGICSNAWVRSAAIGLLFGVAVLFRVTGVVVTGKHSALRGRVTGRMLDLFPALGEVAVHDLFLQFTDPEKRSR